MLCSVLIPSRKRFDKLLKCIESVYAHAASSELFSGFEIIVRFHKSDSEARERCVELDRFEELSAIWGEDLAGYHSLGTFYHELIEVASGKWCWHLNDDMVVMSTAGFKWNEMLYQVKESAALVQPEIHQLNNSVYVFDKAGPAPIHPRNAALCRMLEKCGPAVDAGIYHELAVVRGWPVKFLEGIGVHHQWGGVESHVK